MWLTLPLGSALPKHSTRNVRAQATERNTKSRNEVMNSFLVINIAEAMQFSTTVEPMHACMQERHLSLLRMMVLELRLVLQQLPPQDK